MWIKFILGIESGSQANYIQNMLTSFVLFEIESKRNLVNIFFKIVLKTHFFLVFVLLRREVRGTMLLNFF